MSCDFSVAFDATRTTMTLTHVAGATFGLVTGAVSLDTTNCPVVSWTDTLIVASVPASVAEGLHTVKVARAQVLGGTCEKANVHVPPLPTDPALAVVVIEPSNAALGEQIKIKASGLTFSESLHAPVELRDRADNPQFSWATSQVSGWGTAELTLTLPTKQQYPAYVGTIAGEAHVVRLGESQHRPAFVLLPQGGGLNPLPCDPDKFAEWMQPAADLALTKVSGDPADEIGPGDVVLATIPRTIPANTLGPLLADPNSGYRMDTGLRVPNAIGGSGGLSNGLFTPIDHAIFRLPVHLASAASPTPVDHTVELVARLTTPATVCVEPIVTMLLSRTIRQLPVTVPSVLVLFDKKTPPFDNYTDAGDAVVFVRPDTILGLSDHHDARSGDPGNARSTVVTVLTQLVITIGHLTGSALGGNLPFPSGPQLQRLSTMVSQLSNARRVAVVVNEKVSDMHKVVLAKGTLWDDDADNWAGSGFMVAPPGSAVTAHDDHGHKGDMITLSVPAHSILSDSPSLWSASNTYTNPLRDGTGNWYDKIGSLAWK